MAPAADEPRPGAHRGADRARPPGGRPARRSLAVGTRPQLRHLGPAAHVAVRRTSPRYGQPRQRHAGARPQRRPDLPGAGLIVVVAGALLGCVTGLLAGALGGYVDTVLTWLTNSILCFPAIMLAMAFVMALEPGVTAVVIGLAIHSFPWYMRTLRGEVLRISSLDFVKSAGAIGASRTRTLIHHILPHLISTIVLQMAAVFGASVLSLAALGFLGMGAQPPTAELGAMITDGQQFFLTGQWWLAAFPGLVLLVAVTLTTIVADRARELLDPRGEYVAAD
ncbi:ABC transporter permease [Streptomyces sp. AcE210]|nr:ABC transporter permease [Streptomyces sp. AcE210]